MKSRRDDAPSQATAPGLGLTPRLGSTIISVPDQHVMRDLCLEEGDMPSPSAIAQKKFKVRLANSDGHRMSASFLVQQRYAWRGYEVGSIPGVLPNRVTFSAFDNEEAIATISVGLDSDIGLFVDKLYAMEVDLLRAQKRKVCEFTKLAIDGSVRSKPVLAALFHIAYIFARRLNRCTDLLVEVNPRHVLFYKRMLGFSEWGPERLDPRVQAPAVLLRLDLRFAQQQIAEMGGHAELASAKRSLYPYFFSEREEAGIESRLREFD
jgi:hypothetical protein